MDNQYGVYKGGHKDQYGNYVGGKLVLLTEDEHEAWIEVRRLNSEEFKEDSFPYMMRTGDEVFEIIKGPEMWHVVDKATRGWCYGLCQSYGDAVLHKAWCEKYHYLGSYI